MHKLLPVDPIRVNPRLEPLEKIRGNPEIPFHFIARGHQRRHGGKLVRPYRGRKPGPGPAGPRPTITHQAADRNRQALCESLTRGLIGRVGATELAGVDFFAFQHALGERGIPIVTEQLLENDLASLKAFFLR